MNRLMKKLEDIMVAITFAEAGEYDTAKEILGERDMQLTDAGGTEEETPQVVTERA